MMTTINPLVRDTLIAKSDDILKALKIISSIQSNDKLFVHDTTLIIQPYSTTRAFHRWWNNYNRSDPMEFITKLYDDALKIISQLEGVNSRGKVRTRRKFLQKKKTIESYIKNAKGGLLHLMMTYSNDHALTSSINALLVLTDKYN